MKKRAVIKTGFYLFLQLLFILCRQNFHQCSIQIVIQVHGRKFRTDHSKIFTRHQNLINLILQYKANFCLI